MVVLTRPSNDHTFLSSPSSTNLLHGVAICWKSNNIVTPPDSLLNILISTVDHQQETNPSNLSMSSMNRTLLQNALRWNSRVVRAGISQNSATRHYQKLAHRPNALQVHGSSTALNMPSHVRAFSDKTTEEKNDEKQEQEEPVEEENVETETDKVEELENQLKDMKDQLLRSLAEQENIRRIAKRDVENARNFAVSSFAKSLLDTSDNLSRAMEAVPEDFRSDTENHPVLATLYEGIQMTDDGLTKAFHKNGLKKFGLSGDKFDPNMHEALFEYPDENIEAGSVGQVMKVGFSLNDRVIRPAEVGVTKKA